MGLCLLEDNIVEKYSLNINYVWLLEEHKEAYVSAFRDCNILFGSKAFVP